MNCTPSEGKPFTIITGSSEDLYAFTKSKSIKRSGGLGDWCLHDAHTLLKDTTNIDRKYDYQSHAVQQQIVAQPPFLAIVEGLLCAALGEKTDIVDVPHASGHQMFIHDRDGIQVAPTVAKMVQAYANNIHDTDGNRTFNCMVFMLHEAVGGDGLRKAMDNAITWSQKPWLNMKPSGIDTTTFFAFDACQFDPRASLQWGKLHAAMVDKYNLGAYVVRDNRLSDDDTDSYIDDRRHPCRSRSPRNCHSADDHRSTRANDHRASTDIRPSDHAPTRGSGINPRSYTADSHPIYHERASDRDARTSTRSRMPPYATLAPDAEVWWEVLDELDVDDEATRQLFALAQYNEDGRLSANSIIGKLLKRASDRIHYHTTISAFVASSVTKARLSIEPDWREAAGKGAAPRRRGGKGNNRSRRGAGKGHKK